MDQHARRIIVHISVSILTLVSIPGLARASIDYFQENWADGCRTNQYLPNSAAWFSSGDTSTLTVGSGGMTQATVASAQTIAYFTDEGESPVMLDVGETLLATYTVSFQGLSGSSYFRVGLFDTSELNRKSTDQTGFILGPCGGYAVNFSGLNTGKSGDIRHRYPMVDGGLMSSMSATYYRVISDIDYLSSGLINGVLYTGTVEIARMPESIWVKGTLSGPGGQLFSVEGTDCSNEIATTSFDTIGFISSGLTADSFTLSSVTVQLLPNPSIRFYNTGTTADSDNSPTNWQRSSLEHYGSITQRTNNFYKGPNSIKFYQEFDENYTGRYHAMKGTYRMDSTIGTTRYVGFAFKLASTWNFYSGSDIWLYQTIGYYPAAVDNPPGEDGKIPNTWMDIHGDTNGVGSLWMYRQCGVSTNKTKAHKTVISNLQREKWYKVILKTTFSDTDSGKMEAWIDDAETPVTLNGANCFTGLYDEQWAFFGLYCTDWYGSTSRPVTSVFVYMDEFRIADNKYEADPDKEIDWQFKTETEGWLPYRGIRNWTQYDDQVEGEIYCSDARLMGPDNLNLNCNAISNIYIRMRNNTSGTKASIYFTTTDAPVFGEDKRVNVTMEAYNMTDTLYEFHMSDNTNWAGTLKQLRFDPVVNTVTQGWFNISFIDLD